MQITAMKLMTSRRLWFVKVLVVIWCVVVVSRWLKLHATVEEMPYSTATDSLLIQTNLDYLQSNQTNNYNGSISSFSQQVSSLCIWLIEPGAHQPSDKKRRLLEEVDAVTEIVPVTHNGRLTATDCNLLPLVAIFCNLLHPNKSTCSLKGFEQNNECISFVM